MKRLNILLAEDSDTGYLKRSVIRFRNLMFKELRRSDSRSHKSNAGIVVRTPTA